MPQIEAPTWEDTTDIPTWEDTTEPSAPRVAGQHILPAPFGLPEPVQPLPEATLPAGIPETRPIREGYEPILDIPRATAPKEVYGVPRQLVEVGTGLYNALANAAEGLLTPATALTVGAGAAEQATGRLAAGIWSAFMARSLPEQVNEARKALKEGKPLSEQVEKTLNPILTTALVATGARQALRPEPILTGKQVEAAQEQARLAGLPSQEPIQATKTPASVVPTLPTPENAPTAPPQAPAGIPETPVKVAQGIIARAEAIPEPSGVVRVNYFNKEGENIGYGQLDGRVINNVEVPEAFRRKGVGAEIIADLRQRGGQIGVAGTPEGLALMRSKKVGATEYAPSRFTFEEAPEANTPEQMAARAEEALAGRQEAEVVHGVGGTIGPKLKRSAADEAYDAALEEFRKESRGFGKAQTQYRDRAIGDEEFLAARSRFQKAQGNLDKAETKFIDEKNKEAETAKAVPVAERPIGVETQQTPTVGAAEPIAIAFPGIGSLREADATPIRLGQIKKNDPELWKAITQRFQPHTTPAAIAKAVRAALQRERERQSRAASAGPGAASPVEFEQRAREQGNAAASGQKPPGENPPVATDASAAPNIEVTRANRDYNILNRLNSGQFAFWFGKLGEAAKNAWQRMALGEFRMRESIGRDVKRYVDGLLGSLPREFRRKGGKAFFDIVNGRKFEDIEAEWANRDGGTEIIAAARELKTRLEEIRTTIRDTKREAYNAYLNGLDRPILEDLFRKNIDDQVNLKGYSKEGLAEALTKDAYRDDWGIADGTYLPHLFFGNWKVTVTDASGETRFVTRSKTPEEAKAEIYKFTQRNPELANADFKVEQDTVVPADMIRLGDRRFWQLVGQMKDATGMTQGEVRQAQQGIISRKASKQKWFGSLQKREGYEGYSRDYRQVMGAYLNGFHRWKELSEMQRDVQPMIEAVRREGRFNAANRLDELMENLWGKPARATLEFDALVRRIPGLRDWVKPLALDRWSRNIRTLVSMLTLKTLRFSLVNRLQPLQGLYPLVGERILAQSKILQHTKEGRALLDEAGVSFDPGQYRAERAATGKLATMSERFSGERSNQEIAFLAMFQHGTEQGLSRAQAIDYAKLRGQLFTQFTPLVSDTPQVLHGPFASALFQFKRFPVKQAELLTRMVQEKQFGGIARWLGVMALAGGVQYFMRQFLASGEAKKRLRDKIAAQHGEKVADGVMYGLPGLVGADLSGSLVLGDEPFGSNIYEQAGRQIVGPAASMAIETTRALATPKREPTTPKQDAVAFLRRFPTLRPLGEVLSLEDLDVRSPDGEVKYKKTLKDALLGLGSFRSANESNIKLAVDAMFELKKEMGDLKNRYFVENEQGDPSKAEAAIDKFNERWPELEITTSDLKKYVDYRRKGEDKTDVERISGKKLAPLVP
jgi:hypothetical protein